mmetsp:Transcript_20330/g.30239  ORF Transcript_20330/g.30239 Transcript_20330/m.30239 type:complete len:116 (+) Transcript_20330:2059-2406(+)
MDIRAIDGSCIVAPLAAYKKRRGSGSDLSDDIEDGEEWRLVSGIVCDDCSDVEDESAYLSSTTTSSLSSAKVSSIAIFRYSGLNLLLPSKKYSFQSRFGNGYVCQLLLYISRSVV